MCSRRRRSSGGTEGRIPFKAFKMFSWLISCFFFVEEPVMSCFAVVDDDDDDDDDDEALD